jgi:hypothetical protein
VWPIAGQRRDIAARPGETADDQKILMPADQCRHGVTPVEDEIRTDFGGDFAVCCACAR